jgi:predicted DNA-binding transcriptional regulator YafY
MADRSTAARRFAAILELIPRAARHPEGVPLSDLARELGTDERSILRDLQEVATRSYYLPAGAADDLQISIEESRVSLWAGGKFRRPIRISPRESLALTLGLRVLAAQADAQRRGELLEFARRLEGRLLDQDPSAARFEVHTGPLPTSGLHEILAAAARDRRRCRIAYLKRGARAPEEREIEPYVLLVAEGLWYVVGHCHVRLGIRSFRLDRVISADVLDPTFEVPEDFDPGEYVSDGRVFRADEFQEVTVRYSSRIARWITEREEAEVLQDGSVLCRYLVGDPEWIVRHALEHGPDAEVVAPDELRADVVRALERITGDWKPDLDGEAGVSAR